MALFQSSVIKKELQLLNQTVIDEKWNEFVAHFGNLEIQQKIRGLKEEQYQGEFLDDLFVKVLGYTKPPKSNHNLVTEQKNETNSKKADGAIIVDEKVVGVIELKGTNTTDLEKVKDQAFLYKVNHPECIYVITSNFEKLRFYIENTVDFIEFNLFQLTKKEFSLLYICLSYENIKNNVPKHLKDESVSKENQITKQLYKDYSDFKRALYNNLVELNPQYDKLLLFKKTQKLLDRFLFIFFAEDRQLVPTNLIRRINLEWEDIVKVKRINVSLYDRYKRYFDDLNSGAKVTLPAFGKKTGDAITAQFEIFAYNGGLFAQDDVLDKVSIDDDLLHKHSLLLSDYDFESDVDVNILGHIFENSLNEIDEIKSEIEGATVDKTKTRRKKDGVFYTPKYITKYIVDNTVGKLCTEKKAELKMVDEDYTNDQKIQTKTKKAHLDKLTDYRAWLLQLTICDPACGSGAFLNQALEFLIAEHRYVDELQAKLMGDSMILSDVETSILENNIYGVDLNDESVEIAKLSLWLRTAQKGRKLNSLNNNIKCGNSLIDDPEVAGDKAFSWEKEFPEVFAKGGFDVVIGNPPYVRRTQLSNNLKLNLENKYYSAFKQYDLYVLFNELAINIVKIKGTIGFIQPNKFLSSEYGFKILNLLVNSTVIIKIYDVSLDKVFSDASVYPYIFIYQKNKNALIIEERLINLFDFCKDDDKVGFDHIIKSKKIIDKLRLNSVKISELTNNIKRGVPNSKIEFKDNNGIEGVKSTLLEYPYYLPESNTFIAYIEEKEFELKQKEFNQKLILLPRTTLKIRAILKNNKTHILDRIYYFNLESTSYYLEYLLAILNSKITTFYYEYAYGSTKIGGGYIDLKGSQIENFLIPKYPLETQLILKEKAILLNSYYQKFNDSKKKFVSILQSDFQLEKPSKKIEEFYLLDWSDFNKELQKNKITLLGLSKDDWFDRFDRFKKKALDLISQIDQTDKEIDCMVYELYGLTEEEIQIVENS